jgi:hypothetical protein
MKIDRTQNTTSDGCHFGYVFVGKGGYFFTWRYDADLPLRQQIAQIITTIEADTEDPPTGRHTLSGVERAIRSEIRKNGLYPCTATVQK